MPGLGKQTRRRAEELIDLLETLSPGRSAVPEFLGGLHELIGLNTLLAFSYQPVEDGLGRDWMEACGATPRDRCAHYLAKQVRFLRGTNRPGLYDALSPEKHPSGTGWCGLTFTCGIRRPLIERSS